MTKNKTQMIIASVHSIFAPSSGHRIMVCPGSLNATKDLPNTHSFEAFEGTVAHEIHEYCLKEILSADGIRGGLCSAHSYVGMVYRQHDYEVTVTEEMANYVDESVEWCLEFDGEHFTEQRVCIDPWTPIKNQFGTCDHACIFTDDFGMVGLCITDLKYGKGVQVFAQDNVQLALYALGFYNRYSLEYDIDYVMIRVSQPRLDHRDTWLLSLDELLAFGAKIKARFELAMLPDAPFQPEEHACKFCKLKPTCKALGQMTQELLMGIFEDLDAERVAPAIDPEWPISGPDAASMTVDEISMVLQHKRLIIDFLEQAEKNAIHLLAHDMPVPEFKLVEGKSFRKWKDEKEAAKVLKAKNGTAILYKVKMISPAQAEKLFPRKERADLKKLWDKPVGRPTLARADDKRPTFNNTLFNLFTDIEEDDEEP